MKSLSQVANISDCPETLEEARGIIANQAKSLERARAKLHKIKDVIFISEQNGDLGDKLRASIRNVIFND